MSESRRDVEPFLLPDPSSPYRVAKAIREHLYTDEQGRPLLVYWRGNWWAYAGTHWKQHAPDASHDGDLQLRGELYELTNASVYHDLKGGGMQSWNPNSARISNVIDPLKTQAHMLLSDEFDAPCVIGCTDALDADAGQYVSLSNGLFNWRARELSPHTPALFTTYTLPYEYCATAICPRWDAFLSEVFAHDENGQLLLQEYAGYLVSGRTDLHKGLMIIGPRRAGKGTIQRVLSSLLGAVNVATPTLNGLGTDSGQAALIGRPLAVVGDARAVEPRRSHQVTEFLLNVIGEDGVSIGRKYLANWTGKLPTRFVISSNEVPRFTDASGAVVSRFISVRLKKSYEGQ